MPTVAVYARASVVKDDLRISVDRQLARCTELAEKLFPGATIRPFLDNNKSGAKVGLDRPGYNDLLEAVRQGEVDEVVTHEQSWLTRQELQWVEIKLTFPEAGIDKIYTVQEGTVSLDPDADDSLIGSIRTLLDQREARKTSKRLLAMHEQLAKEGRPGGLVAYGYRGKVLAADGETWVALKDKDGRPRREVVPEEAKIVNLIADRLIGGYSIRSVTAELTAMSVPAPRGRGWRDNSVKAVVVKPAVAGYRVHKGKIVGPASWEAIIEPERWRKVLRALRTSTVMDVTGKSHVAIRQSRPTARHWLLTGGLAVCGRCGGQMMGGPLTGRKGRPNAYRCHRGYVLPGGKPGCGAVQVCPAEDVEKFVVKEVLDALDKPALGKRLAGHPDPERAGLVAELADANDRMRQAAALWGAGAMDQATWESFHYPAKARVEAATKALNALPDPDVDLPPAAQLRQKWDQMPPKQKRAVLERCIVSVTVLPSASGIGRPKKVWADGVDVTTARRMAGRLHIEWRRPA